MEHTSNRHYLCIMFHRLIGKLLRENILCGFKHTEEYLIENGNDNDFFNPLFEQ